MYLKFKIKYWSCFIPTYHPNWDKWNRSIRKLNTYVISLDSYVAFHGGRLQFYLVYVYLILTDACTPVINCRKCNRWSRRLNDACPSSTIQILMEAESASNTAYSSGLIDHTSSKKT
uniref:Uncharacterized protein n=1 Tax=Glossina austeni TaxID=7395 RepID=A0A1A9UIR6_GLOAU